MNKPDNPSQTNREWEIESREVVYKGFYTIEKFLFRHALFDGGQSGLVEREQFVRGNVVGVIAHDPKLDRVALIEQFRMGARNRKDHPWLLEVIAGMIEPSENPQDVAIREAYEEAGITLENLKEVMRYLASPGSSSEEVFIYYAEADLSEASGVHGLESEIALLINQLLINSSLAMQTNELTFQGYNPKHSRISRFHIMHT